MNIRESAEALEKEYLSPYACLSTSSKGRDRAEEECAVRTVFVRDRDRIIHSKAFRRLKHKTQVFFAPEGDHYRTRLTHTLEVAQIARTVARALRLNEDLTEAIALGHDLGHAPFGHSGEAILAEIASCGFAHNVHSVRVVETLEKERNGLNLTKEVRDGILHHSGNGRAATLEGRIVAIADRIAYVNHDMDDACRAGVLRPSDLPKEYTDVLGDTHTKRINHLILALIRGSTGDEIQMDAATTEALRGMRSFLFERVYHNKIAKKEEAKAKTAMEMLFRFYLEHPNKLPDHAKAFLEEDGLERALVDYLAGMTDRYVIGEFETIFVPKTWR